MQAIVNERYGNADVLQLKEVPKPAPKDDEVLIQVMATSLNSADWRFLTADPFFIRFMNGLVRPKVTILGADVAGVVVAAGPGAARFRIGDAVFGELGVGKFGGLAEYVRAPERLLVAKPDGMTFVEAAALPMAGLTALQGLRDHGGIQAGQKVLIVGASGGVGSFAVQIAKVLGAEVTAVCSTSKMDQARALGATHVIDYTREDFTRNGQQYDVIFVANGNRSLGEFERALAPTGTLVIAGGGMRQLFQTLLLGPRKSRSGGKTYKNFTAHTSADDLAILVDMVVAGEIKPPVDRSYPLAEAPEAMRYLGAGHAKGKVVVVVASKTRD
ncbi:MAG: NAD(P)-dependent alcohol dehydrogenase [Chloroflexota bacterium]|jgi:NADPH:quinone reductase-like Zn-dependent oxidoreductase